MDHEEENCSDHLMIPAPVKISGVMIDAAETRTNVDFQDALKITSIIVQHVKVRYTSACQSLYCAASHIRRPHNGVK